MSIRKFFQRNKVDYGVGCVNRVFTHEHNIACRENGIRKKRCCKNCKDKRVF